MGMYTISIEAENESLRERIRLIREKAAALSAAVERYTRQDISRSMLLHIKRDLDDTINPSGRQCRIKEA